MFVEVLRNGHWTGTTWGRRKNGSVYREWRSVRAVKDMNGAVTHYVHGVLRGGGPGPERRGRRRDVTILTLRG